MSLPVWVTPSDLGSYPQDYSFNLNPVIVNFSSRSGSRVILLNGSLPLGLSWSVVNSTIEISGVFDSSSTTLDSRFTFRIVQSDGLVADRTFVIKITQLPVEPNWTGQKTFLGYQNSVNTETYLLTAAVPHGEFVSYSLVLPVANMEIDQKSGLLTYTASVYSSSATLTFGVRATSTSTGLFNDIYLTIGIVVSPLDPRWVTSGGVKGTFFGGEYIDINLEAVDVSGATVEYSILSNSPEFPLNLSPLGNIYGRLPNVLSQQVYELTVRASSINGFSDESFSVIAVPSDLFSLLTWETPEDLGAINEGDYAGISVIASTQRKTVIVYNVTGGMLPPHLMLEKTSGTLVGFCEYHATSKTYYFDVTADDGYQQITKQFKITVNKIYGDQFFGASIPVFGDLRDRFAKEASNVRVRGAGTAIFYGITYPEDPPVMNIINGVVTGYKTPDDMVNRSGQWLKTLDLRIGSVDVANVSVGSNGLIYQNIVDMQLGSNSTVYSSSVYNTNVSTNGTVYPISIENIRKALIGNDGFIKGGSGKGCSLIPIIDWSTGAISGVTVINPGSGYLTPPEIQVSGSGRGAVLKSTLGLVSISVIDTGKGWNVGDKITIPGKVSNGHAVVEVTEIGTNGSLASFKILSPGSYLQVSSNNSTLIIQQDGESTARVSSVWGVIGVNVVEPGHGYQCGVEFDIDGSEILPPWQQSYSPIITIGEIPRIVSEDAVSVLNTSLSTLFGLKWQPNYIVFSWQGLRWSGTTSFDNEKTTFDGRATNFEEAEGPYVTVFDEDRTIFNDRSVTFDQNDPLFYDMTVTWGSTIVDSGSTVFDLYSTIFDSLRPRRSSNTLIRKIVMLQQRVYSGNNAVW